jgi:hypothetical protein
VVNISCRFRVLKYLFHGSRAGPWRPAPNTSLCWCLGRAYQEALKTELAPVCGASYCGITNLTYSTRQSWHERVYLLLSSQVT